MSTAGSVSGHNRTNYSMATQMFQASRPPPRLRPPMIILVVLAIGVMFIGLTMTIIAHWPGYSAVGGNPLEIAGPIVLAVGGVVLIMALINIFWMKSVEKQKQEEARVHMSMSKQSLVSRQNYNMQQRPMQPPSGMNKKGGPGSDLSGPIHSSSLAGSDFQGNPYKGMVSNEPMPGQKPATHPKPVYANQAYTRDQPMAESSPDGRGGYQPKRQMQDYGPGGYDAYEPGSLANGYRPPSQTSLTGSGAGMGVAGRLNSSFEDDRIRDVSGVALQVPPGQQPRAAQYQQYQQQHQRTIATHHVTPGTHSYRPPSTTGSHTDTEV